MSDPSSPRPAGPPAPVDRRRFRTIRRFLLRAVAHLLWWDVLLARPLFARWRPPPLPRWRALARGYRELAVRHGGVLIKLGQFLSTRVDLFPPEVTGELAELQDEVPPTPFPPVLEALEADLGRPVSEVFTELDPAPLGAASLAQVYRARLRDGEEVVVKVLRPGIEGLVETDLAALAAVGRWLRRLPQVRRRVDVGRLLAEFARTTRRELSMPDEAASIDRFAACFAERDDVVVPRVYPEASSLRTLTLEDVSGIKVTDTAALAAAGVDPAAVARTLYGLYMEQLFVHHLVHADPHPGNLFVHPRGEVPDDGTGRPFAVAFVDFGMMATIPPRLHAALREYLIGLGMRDARRIVDAYRRAGVLLPGADLLRLEEAHEALFAELWGVPIGELPTVAVGRAPHWLAEYRDLVFEAPFQFPVDLLFATRAVGLLAGLTTALDASFDPWEATRPYARQAARRELLEGGIAGQLAGEAAALWRLPRELDAVLARVQRGSIAVQAAFAPEARRDLRRLEGAIVRLSWTVLATGLFVAGALLRSAGAGPLEVWGSFAAGVLCVGWALTR